jgi:predicted TIM-barrel fold metal-dependent hydrolase
VARHKPNVDLDMSGWSPKLLPQLFVQDADTILRKKTLFGSDRPAITPDRRLADVDTIGIRDEVRPLILKDIARRSLKL